MQTTADTQGSAEMYCLPSHVIQKQKRQTQHDTTSFKTLS